MVHRCPLCTKRSTAPCAVSCNRHASQRPCRWLGGGKGEYLQNQFPELGIRNLELWAHRGCTQRGAFWLITIQSIKNTHKYHSGSKLLGTDPTTRPTDAASIVIGDEASSPPASSLRCQCFPLRRRTASDPSSCKASICSSARDPLGKTCRRLPSWTHSPAKRRRANKTLIVASMALRLRECFAPLDIGHEHCNQQASAHAMAQVIHITLSVFSLFCSLAYRPHDPDARFPATGSLLR